MCIFCLLFWRELASRKLPSPNTTFRLPASILEDDQQLVNMVEWDTLDYVTSRLKPFVPSKALPLQTTGDGDCLLHAISRAIWGVEQYSDLLRKCLLDELQSNTEWYKNAVSPPEEVDHAIRQAQQQGQHLSFLHVFALSNVLKRPIIVYASDEDIEKFGTGENAVAGTFVPSRWSPEVVRARPIALTWSNSYRRHFVPLVAREGMKFEWPLMAPAFVHTIPKNFTVFHYIREDLDDESPELAKLLEDNWAEKFNQLRQYILEYQRVSQRLYTLNLTKALRTLEKPKSIDVNETSTDDELRLQIRQCEKRLDELERIVKEMTLSITNDVKSDAECEKEDKNTQQISHDKSSVASNNTTNNNNNNNNNVGGSQTKESNSQSKRRDPSEDTTNDSQTSLTIDDFYYEDIIDQNQYEFFRLYRLDNKRYRVLGFNRNDSLSDIWQKFSDIEKDLMPENRQLARLDIIEALNKAKNDSKNLTRYKKIEVLEMTNLLKQITLKNFSYRTPIIYVIPKFEKLIPALKKFNDSFKNDPTKQHLVLQSDEIESFEKMIYTLQKQDPDYEHETFNDKEFNIMWKLLTWPVEKMTPVLDVLRVLLLYQNAAGKFFEVSLRNCDSNNRFTEITDEQTMSENRDLMEILLRLCESNQPHILFLVMKCLTNTLTLRSFYSLFRKYQMVILNEVVTKALATNESSNFEVAISLLKNFAIMFYNTPTSQENTIAKIVCAKRVATLLMKLPKTDSLKPFLYGLQALGTLIHKDLDTKTVVFGDIESAVLRLIQEQELLKTSSSYSIEDEKSLRDTIAEVLCFLYSS
jgi:hypothetical protein